MPPVEIQWCDHSSVLLEYLRQLYDEGRFVDVGLECEGQQVKAHKAVISACSPYLEGLLKGNPARSHLIKFNGYSYRSLRAVIDFMYNGKVMIEQENLAAFLKLGRALQVRGILDIAAQCEEAGLTTAEETKSNAQYSTTVQQSQKASQHQKAQQTQSSQQAEKKYAFLLDKASTGQAGKRGPAPRKTQPNIIGSVDQTSGKVAGVSAAQAALTAQQPLQTTQTQAVQLPDGSAAATTTTATALEELQQALASGQAIIQTSDSGDGGEALQMVEGQCVVTGSGQTYVVVQEGENLSFVPAEMVQGELQEVNGGQAVLDDGQQVQGAVGQDTGSLDTMSVVESLVKLGQKQPMEIHTGTEEQTEVGPDMPCLDADLPDSQNQVGPDMADLEDSEIDTAEDLAGSDDTEDKIFTKSGKKIKRLVKVNPAFAKSKPETGQTVSTGLQARKTKL